MSGIVRASFQFASLSFIRQVKTARLLLNILVLVCAARSSAAETIWIDTDISIGSPFREVDDAFALLLAFHSPNLKLAGISTSYGNAPLIATTSSAHALISKIDSPRAIYPGARSRNDLGRESDATTRLAAQLQREALTYVALGPLTNLATLQLRYPALARRIKRVVFIGGTRPGTALRFGSRHRIQIHDANVVKDPAALAQVLRSGIPITLIPAEIAAQLTVTAADLDAMRADRAGDYIQRKSRLWLWFWMKFVGTEGAPIFDAAAILAVTDPDQFVIVRRTGSVSSVVKLSNRAKALNLVRRRVGSTAGHVP
jgi:inosine-uridine nucleoside N-ribohydrolase